MQLNSYSERIVCGYSGFLFLANEPHGTNVPGMKPQGAIVDTEPPFRTAQALGKFPHGMFICSPFIVVLKTQVVIAAFPTSAFS